MGWLFMEGQTRRELIERLIRAEENEVMKRICVRRVTKGNVLWTVFETTIKKSGVVSRWIGCFIMQPQRGYGWGYKDLEEASGPYYYTCPLSFLRDVPEVTNEEWRQQVREYHARHSTKGLRIGDKVALVVKSPPWVTITSVKPLRGSYGSATFHLQRNLIDRTKQIME